MNKHSAMNKKRMSK